MHSKKISQITYLDETDVLVIHAKMIELTGGSDGIRDIELVKGAMARPQSVSFGKELFESVFEKAAVYFDSVARSLPFVDGNKRTAFSIAVRFLYINDYEFYASNNEVETYVIEAVASHHEIEQVAAWFDKNSRKIQ